jgi:hypothetical protein
MKVGSFRQDPTIADVIKVKMGRWSWIIRVSLKTIARDRQRENSCTDTRAEVM